MKYNNRMRKQSGFTVIELVFAILFLIVVGTVFMLQKNQLSAVTRDTQRKTAINAMYYNLVEVYFPAHKSYPRTISSTNLKAMDPELFKDPAGNAVGERESTYRYEPTGCDGDACTGFMVRADLEKESDFARQK